MIFASDSTVYVTYPLSLIKRLRMKSLASSDIPANASSSKSYFAIVTFAMVSTSVSPMKGDSPDNLDEYGKTGLRSVCNAA